MSEGLPRSVKLAGKIIAAEPLAVVIADSWMEYIAAKNTHNVLQSLLSEMLFIS